MKTITHLKEKIVVSETEAKRLQELGIIHSCKECEPDVLHLHRDKEWADIDSVLLSPVE